MSHLLSMEYVIAFIFGTIVGSFANVCIHRIPWHQSLIFPQSHCPHCQQALRPWHNIPILSYVLLNGRCAYCSITIPWRYPFVEFLCGLLYVFVYDRFGVSPQGIVFALLATALLIVSFIDLAYKIIPDKITLPGIVAGIAASLVVTPVSFVSSVTGMILGGGLFFLVALLSHGGMGGGISSSSP